MEQERSFPPESQEYAAQDGKALHALACHGDEEAVEALLERYRAPLTAFVRAMLYDPRDIEETVLDAFAELCASRGRFRGKSSLKTYLFAIARHLALRHRKRQAELPLQDSLPYDARPGLNLDQSLEDLPLRADLQSALSKISEAPRLALTLLYYQGMIHQEAGEVLGKTPAQVARLAQQGRQTLKRLLAE